MTLSDTSHSLLALSNSPYSSSLAANTAAGGGWTRQSDGLVATHTGEEKETRGCFCSDGRRRIRDKGEDGGFHQSIGRMDETEDSKTAPSETFSSCKETF